MVEHGLYILKEDFFDLIQSLGGVFDMSSGSNRPTYCCIKDNKVEGLYWAIPTSTLSNRDSRQLERIREFIALDNKDLRSCYYHIGHTTVPAIYKVSSCFPITQKYVDHEFTTNGVHVVMRNNELVANLERKLKRILSFEFRKPNYFEQRISDIRNYLINELNL